MKSCGWRSVILFKRQQARKERKRKKKEKEKRKKETPKKKKSKKAKWLSEEALQIAKERREAKSKGERERCIQLNAGFQRTAWRERKAFFNE